VLGAASEVSTTLILVIGGLVTTVVTVIGGIIVALVNHGNRKSDEALKAIGNPNGMESIADGLHLIKNRLDKQDVEAAAIAARLAAAEKARAAAEAAAEADRASRVEGQERQAQMQVRQNEILDSVANILHSVAEIRSVQATFITRDEFAGFTAGLDRISALLGEKEPGWDPRPALPYIHDEVHKLRGELQKANDSNALLADRVVVLVKQVAALSAVLDVPPVEPDLSDDTTPEAP
jgi:hypothetical protein